ncbi:Pre protein translocase Sec Sec61-beta subunit [Clavulina sp. PMI_390]|nr:Pre protein translocase Sec Sec61-beta subunit [Clavulina sp. PMI_390]
MSDSESSRPTSPTGVPPRPGAASTVSRPPGAGQVRRRATNNAVQKANSTRSAGAGGSSGTMLKLYTDDSPGLRVDPFVVMMLSIVFIFSIFFLHLAAKFAKWISK